MVLRCRLRVLDLAKAGDVRWTAQNGDYNANRHLCQGLDGRQRARPENQLPQLRAWCSNAGHPIVGEYVDHESGRKGADKRKQFAALFEDASRRKFDSVLFWALDRFSREGMVPTIMHLQRLNSCGISFHSYTEAHLATDNELVRNVLLAVLASLAKVEAAKLSERTRAGMARARARGKAIGRPSISPQLRAEIAARAATGATAYRIARDLGIESKERPEIRFRQTVTVDGHR